MKPANDNAPRHADDFADNNARRAWLEKLPADAKPVLAWPTFERLSRLASPEAAGALYRYKELMEPARMPAANDNDPDAPEMGEELRHEIRPTIRELMAAIHDEEGNRLPVAVNDNDVQIGALSFRDGTLVKWGTTERGKDLWPVERQRMPKGATHQARPAERIRYLVKTDAPIAKGAIFLGGKKGGKGITTRPDIGDHDAAIEMARNQRRAATRLALGDHAWVLDAAITDSTAREVGEMLGHAGKAAERRGIAAISDAIKEFQKIAG